MYLGLKDLIHIFSDIKGVQDDHHFYVTVSDQAKVSQPKGLFVPLWEHSGELLEAISNGAIAAIWDKKKKVPHYTPNHFPLFLTDEPMESVRSILQLYLEKLDGENVEKMNMTEFVFLNKELLKEDKQTYDIAVMLEKLSATAANSNFEGRE